MAEHNIWVATRRGDVQVAQRLLQEFPHLDTLVTLSPIPGFGSWLTAQLDRGQQRGAAGNDSTEVLLLSREEHALMQQAESLPSRGSTPEDSQCALAELQQILSAESWLHSNEVRASNMCSLKYVCCGKEITFFQANAIGL